MSDILVPTDVHLRVRQYPDDVVRPRVLLGTTSVVYAETVDRSGKLLPVEGTLAAIYRLPHRADFPTRYLPALITQLAMGQWRVDVPTVMSGRYFGWLILLADGWGKQTSLFQFDVPGDLS